MTGIELLEQLANIEKSGVMKDVPLSIAVGKSDALAAKMLIWLVEQMPKDATSQDIHDVLDAAKWWQTLLETMNFAQKGKSK